MLLTDVLQRVINTIGLDTSIDVVSETEVRTIDLAEDRFMEAKEKLSKIAFYNEGIVKSSLNEIVIETREFLSDEWVRVRTYIQKTYDNKTRISSKIYGYETLTFGGQVVICRDKKIKDLVGL